jgi:anti-sigma factor RsiW
MGQPSAMVARHIHDCPACRRELENFRAAIGGFRGAVRRWSEDQAGKYRENGATAISPAILEPHSWMASHQLALALLIAVVCVIASFVVPRHGAESAAGSDALLLNQVDAQVSRAAPSSMEPLMKLVVEK